MTDDNSNKGQVSFSMRAELDALESAVWRRLVADGVTSTSVTVRLNLRDLISVLSENERLSKKVDELQANASKLVMEHQARKEQNEYLSREVSRLLNIVDLRQKVMLEDAERRKAEGR